MELAIAQRLYASRALRTIMTPLSNWFVNAMGYQKYGLRLDDIVMEENPEMQEALRRLPAKENDLRQYRHKVAMQYSIMHNVLPKEQWTTREQDKQYLTPLFDEVIAEKKERQAYDTPEKNPFGASH